MTVNEFKVTMFDEIINFFKQKSTESTTTTYAEQRHVINQLIVDKLVSQENSSIDIDELFDERDESKEETVAYPPLSINTIEPSDTTAMFDDIGDGGEKTVLMEG